MKQVISEFGFRDAFRDCGRHEQFSYDALNALFEYFEQYEEDCDTEIELDAIAICCEFTEYGSAIECLNDAGYDFEPEGEDEDEKEESAMGFLNDNTSVIRFTGGIIIADF